MKLILSKLAVTVLMVPFVHGVTLLNFDGATSMTTTGTPLPAVLTLENAYWETLDDKGDLLVVPGFRADITSPTVVVGDPNLSFYGPSISGNALSAVDGPVMFSFASALNLSSFGVTLDNSSLGNILNRGGNPAFSTNILFYDAADTLIGYIELDQTVSGLVVSDRRTFENVSKVVLPSGAFYDNISFMAQAVPEPTSAALVCLSFLTLFRRRRLI